MSDAGYRQVFLNDNLPEDEEDSDLEGLTHEAKRKAKAFRLRQCTVQSFCTKAMIINSILLVANLALASFFLLIDSMLRAIGRDVGITHVDHCIDALRQHQMCAVDITPNVFQYSPQDFGIRAMANVVHECRDFEKIKEWARDHRAPPYKGFGDGEAIGKCALNDSSTCLYN